MHNNIAKEHYEAVRRSTVAFLYQNVEPDHPVEIRQLQCHSENLYLSLEIFTWEKTTLALIPVSVIICPDFVSFLHTFSSLMTTVHAPLLCSST